MEPDSSEVWRRVEGLHLYHDVMSIKDHDEMLKWVQRALEQAKIKSNKCKERLLF